MLVVAVWWLGEMSMLSLTFKKQIKRLCLHLILPYRYVIKCVLYQRSHDLHKTLGSAMFGTEPAYTLCTYNTQ